MQEQLIGEKYEILERLGQGGTASVFRVYDLRLQKVWAAKCLKKDGATTEELMLGRLGCDFFPRIVDVVEQGESRYLIMDWIDGETLEKKMQRDGAFGEEEAARIGIALCRAVGSLHKMQPPVLYLDCKPSNIMIDSAGKLKLIDFGSAAMMESPEAEGFSASPGFAAPEQMRRNREERRVDVRTDVFGAGRTLYALLTGADMARPPYAACRLRERCVYVSREMEEIVEKCTASVPEERFQTMDGLKAALEGLLDGGKSRAFGKGKLLGHGLYTVLLPLATLTAGALFLREASGKKGNVYGSIVLLFWTVLLGYLADFFRKKMRSPGCAVCEPLQSVLRTEKSPGRWMLP